MPHSKAPTEDLAYRILNDDQSACSELFERYRPQLTRAVEFRLDRRLAVRVDAADIVQEALAEAHRRIAEFLEKDGYCFYAWIRKIAISRLKDAQRRHVAAGKRSVHREVNVQQGLSDESVFQLADRLAASGVTPSAEVRKKEAIECLTDALDNLSEVEREVLILKFIEELSPAEIAAVQEVDERTIRRRQRRAVEKLGWHLRNAGWDSQP